MDRSPIRLDNVVDVDRHRIDALLTEAGRATDTPGVHHDLAVDVIASMGAHADVVDEVLDTVGLPPLEAGGQVRDALLMYEASLAAAELGDLRAVWGRYGAAVADVVAELRDVRGERAVARLGYAFSERLEAHCHRRPRASSVSRD